MAICNSLHVVCPISGDVLQGGNIKGLGTIFVGTRQLANCVFFGRGGGAPEQEAGVGVINKIMYVTSTS